MNALVSVKDGAVRASSQDVADAFEKAHKNVIQAIDKLIDLAPELSRLNFQPRTFVNRGRHYRSYEMDRDGFSLLAMGFTGAKALEWKLKFLDAFRRMEEALSRSLSANDNALAGLHPMLQSAEGREALRAGMDSVRRMQAARGGEAAIAMWKTLGLPLPDDIDDYSLPALERALTLAAPAKGEMFAWVAARKVRADPDARVHWKVLWDDYVTWCVRQELLPYNRDKFRWHLKNHFGGEHVPNNEPCSLAMGGQP